MKYELPVPIHEENKWTALLVCSVVFLFGYIIPNRYHFITPIYLQMTAVDLAVPLVPWTIFIYQSEYVYFFIAYAYPREDTRNRYFYSFLTVGGEHGLFVFWPGLSLMRILCPWTSTPGCGRPLPCSICSMSPATLSVPACQRLFVTAFAFYRESKVKLAFSCFGPWPSASQH